MNNHTLLYIVTDTTAHRGKHITMTGPEQFINWIETEIIHYNKRDGQIVDLAYLLIGYLNRQIAGKTTHQLVISVAKELDFADWNE